MANLNNLRKFAKGVIDESTLGELNVDENETYDLEDEEFLAECAAVAMPLFLQTQILGESAAEYLDEATTETFHRLETYFVGQGIMTEAAVTITNPKINVVHLNKEAQINRLKTIFTLKLARKNNSNSYKKYKLAVGLKKKYREDMDKKFGQRAFAIAKKFWMQHKKSAKIGSSVASKKETISKK